MNDAQKLSLDAYISFFYNVNLNLFWILINCKFDSYVVCCLFAWFIETKANREHELHGLRQTDCSYLYQVLDSHVVVENNNY